MRPDIDRRTLAFERQPAQIAVVDSRSAWRLRSRRIFAASSAPPAERAAAGAPAASTTVRVHARRPARGSNVEALNQPSGRGHVSAWCHGRMHQVVLSGVTRSTDSVKFRREKLGKRNLNSDASSWRELPAGNCLHTCLGSSPRQGEASSKGSQQMLPDLMSDLLIHTSLRVHERDRGFAKAARTRKAF